MVSNGLAGTVGGFNFFSGGAEIFCKKSVRGRECVGGACGRPARGVRDWRGARGVFGGGAEFQ